MNRANGHRQLMIVAIVFCGTPNACPVSSNTRHGEGSVTSLSPPNSGLIAPSP